MAQKSSRSKKSRKQPELRTGGGRTAKARRSEERTAAATRTSETGPMIRIRPAGIGGSLLMLLVAWAGVALVVFAGALLSRWNVMSYPDSLWLYTAIGTAAVAPALGGFARSALDADGWAAQALLVPLGMLAGEIVLGPECPPGGECAAIGARGSLGLVGSFVVIVLLAAVAWGLARATYARARDRRPASGRVRPVWFIVAFLGSMLLLATPLAAAFAGVDLLTRSTPKLAQAAGDYVEQRCLALGASTDMAVRAAPEGIQTSWTTFAVRRADEDRPGIGKKSLPTNWSKLDAPYPYEAIISYDDGEVVSLNCRKVDPASGNAVAEDLVPNEPASNPLDPATTGATFQPLFYTQGPKVPTAAEKKADAAKAAKDKTAKAAAAKKAAAATKK